ncbi:palmitoyltransferase [Ceratobasidium sp. 428]|nr:palmitoyltransferase [Ceratobasidium sp. 428]
MRLYGLSILRVIRGKSTLLVSASDLSILPLDDRGVIAEFLVTFTKQIAERTPTGQPPSTQEDSYVFHVSDYENLVGVLVSDEDYPAGPALALLAKILHDFAISVPNSTNVDSLNISFPQLEGYLIEYQDPRRAESIMREQREVDEAITAALHELERAKASVLTSTRREKPPYVIT